MSSANSDTFTLLEYGTSSEEADRAALFLHSGALGPYVSRKWLAHSFAGDQPCVRALHHVGLLPFSAGGTTRRILIAPKGCRQDERLGLLRFLELLALTEGASPPDGDEMPGLAGAPGAHPFLLFLAHAYARSLQELCRRDFRSYYRAEEGDLRGRVRGRLHLPGHARNSVRGRGHVLPCRWEEFTTDNWDNRILWAAARRLQRVAAAFDPEAGARASGLFAPLLSWFGGVAEVPVTPADFQKSRLGRTSLHYRQALGWARLLLRGGDLPVAGGRVPPLVLDANAAFERLAESVTREALPGGWRVEFQRHLDFLSGAQKQHHRPDAILSDPRAARAVGDAKYKDVLEREPDAPFGTAGEAVEVGLRPTDWDQLYVYMRLTGARRGYFVVPFWDAGGPYSVLTDDFRFTVPPCEAGVSVAVLALNLLRPIREVRQDAAERLRDWLA